MEKHPFSVTDNCSNGIVNKVGIMDLPVPQQRSEFKCNCISFLRILGLFDLLPPEDLSLFNIALILPMSKHIIFVTKYYMY